MRFFRESESTSIEKYNRTYRLYNDIFKIDIERVIKTKIINIILRSRLNSIKRLFNALIR